MTTTIAPHSSTRSQPIDRSRTGALRLAIVGAPLLLGAGLVIHPKEVTGEAEQLGIVTRHASAWGTAHLLIYLGSVLMVAAIIGLVRLADRHDARGAGIAGAVAGFGAVALAATAAIEMVTRHLAEAGGDATTRAAVFHSFEKAGDLGLAVFLPEFALSIGLIGLAVVLWRSHALTGWAALAIGAGGVLAPVPVIALRDLGAAILVAGMVAAAARLSSATSA